MFELIENLERLIGGFVRRPERLGVCFQFQEPLRDLPALP
jgi:hypothetical protein